MYTLIASIITAFFTGGFFSFAQFLISRKDKSKSEICEIKETNKQLQKNYENLSNIIDKQSAMLLGIGHDRIVEIGTECIEKQYITKDEFENLYDYLYTPYHNLGGNGTAEKIINDVKRLPIRNRKENDHEQ